MDLLYALRTLRENPGFAATAILTLALGIGGNTTIFTVIRAVLLKPLPWRDPGRLVKIGASGAPRPDDLGYLSLGHCQHLRANARSFDAFGASFAVTEDMTLAGQGEPEAVKAARVSANFLEVLGAAPLLGRSFLPEEDQRGGRPVALISSGLWRRRFAADPGIAGRTAALNSTPYTILGVLPAGFDLPFAGVDVWVTRPAEYSALPPAAWDTAPTLSGIARLKPGVRPEQALAEINVLSSAYSAAHPGLRDSERRGMRLVWLRDQIVASVRPMLWTLFGAVGFVLLIACANVASLLLARATSRKREFAVRAALGAPRRRIVGQLLAESLCLSVAGGALGIVLAIWSLRAVTRMTSFHLPRSGEIHLDGMVLAFSIALSILTGILFGLVPSLHASRPDLAGVLRESGAGAGRASIRRGLLGGGTRGLLVVAQVALSIVLLIGAALLIKSFARLRQVDPGFQPANLLTMRIALPPARYDTAAKRLAFFQDLIQRVTGLPGVRAAAIAQTLPTLSPHYASPMQVIEQPVAPPNERPSGLLQSVTPGYFSTLGIPLRRGREFNERENTRGAAPTVVINESAARRLWPSWPHGPDPVGQHLAMGSQARPDRGFEIIGVAADVHENGLAADAGPVLYLPALFRAQQTVDLGVRTVGDPLRLVAAVRTQVTAIDRDQPVSDVRTMDEVLEDSLGQRRLTLLLLASFAGVALLLALLGLYGAISYSVVQRTQELGIRRALGAQQRDILRLVLTQALALASAGVVIGVAGAFALTRLMKTLLFQVSAADPPAFVGIAILFLAVALAASYIPARRASRTDPMSALR